MLLLGIELDPADRFAGLVVAVVGEHDHRHDQSERECERHSDEHGPLARLRFGVLGVALPTRPASPHGDKEHAEADQDPENA